MSDFIEINKDNFDLELDLRYATTNNVCQQILYKETTCYLHEETAQKLKTAIRLAKQIGLRIKIFDGYRPIAVQQFMYDMFPGQNGQESFVSNPKNGRIPHCRGVAIDLTLIDKNNQELDMGSDFDEFSEIAFHDCDKISSAAKKNRLILLGIMTEAGFDMLDKEWWHYQLPNVRNYEVIQNHNDLSMFG